MIWDREQRILFTSDVEGPVNDDAVNFMIENPADLVIVDGPPTYLAGTKKEVSNPDTALRALVKYLSVCTPKHLVIDHHLLRDLNYVKFYELLRPYIKKTKLLTAAEYMGESRNSLRLGGKSFMGIDERLYDPLELSRSVESLVTRVSGGSVERKYFRFRGGRWYGGIASADVIGCNLRCRFCWAWYFRDRHDLGFFLSPEKVFERLSEIALKRGYRYLRLTGENQLSRKNTYWKF